MSDAATCTRQEMMAIATGREIRDGELAIFGVGLSMLAGYFAQASHAPNIRAMTEGGVYGATPVGGLPWGIECNRISANATSFTSALDALGCLVASGRCDVGIIGAAQVDKFGNVNTTGSGMVRSASITVRPRSACLAREVRMISPAEQNGSLSWRRMNGSALRRKSPISVRPDISTAGMLVINLDS